MRDFLLFLALLLAVFNLAAGGLRSDAGDDGALAELNMQVSALQSQNEQIYRLLGSLSTDVDAYVVALTLMMPTWNRCLTGRKR